MSDSPQTWTRLRDAVLQVYCWTLIFLIIYILSIGPLYWYWYDAVYLNGHTSIALFYYPLSLACETFQPLDDWVGWYIEVWNS